jgi:geranylgeranyl diphosphate synthase type II
LGGGDDEQIEILLRYGHRIGIAFQIADDLLNLDGDAEEMGKAVGSDAARGKITYPAAAGVKAARDTGWRLVDEAQDLCAQLGEKALPLSLLARYIMERTN